MLARMERDGWVHREVDAADQRISRVVLTEAGRNLADVLPGRVLSHFGALLSPFPQEKQAMLLGMLRELRVIFENIEERGGSARS
jgi:DNA-binding MarR family transcriptional regulator